MSDKPVTPEEAKEAIEELDSFAMAFTDPLTQMFSRGCANGARVIERLAGENARLRKPLTDEELDQSSDPHEQALRDYVRDVFDAVIRERILKGDDNG
jgi:hypothetical protein